MLAFLSVLWGSSFLFVKIAAGALEPFSLAFGRVAIGAAALMAAALVARAPWPRGRKLWTRLAILGLLGQVAPFLLLAVAARMTTSADLALMMGGAPIFTFALAWVLGQGETWSARTAVGLALGLAGVVVCIGFPHAGGAVEYPLAAWGRALALLAALGYAFGATLSREASRQVGPTMAAAASMLFSALALGCLWIVVDRGGALAAFSQATPSALGAMAALGFFNTALAYLVYYRLVASAGATFAALNNYIVPFLGLIAGAAMLDEPIALSAWIGFVLVIAGVALTRVAPAIAPAAPRDES